MSAHPRRVRLVLMAAATAALAACGEGAGKNDQLAYDGCVSQRQKAGVEGRQRGFGRPEIVDLRLHAGFSRSP